MINISIDPPDLRQWKKAYVSEEDLSINEIESIYELVSEECFDFNVPETDDQDIDTKFQTIDLYCCNMTYSTSTSVNTAVEHYAYFYNNFSFDSTEPNSPPPKYS